MILIVIASPFNNYDTVIKYETRKRIMQAKLSTINIHHYISYYTSSIKLNKASDVSILVHMRRNEFKQDTTNRFNV